MKKVVVLGPESTGKSTLCEQLSSHYDTIFCPEFAREFLAGKTGKYNYGDLLDIAKGQIYLEDKLLADARNGLYFIDTDMYVMKIWCEVAFHNCHNWILRQIAERKYDLFLLCDVDLPWVPDELREYPELKVRQRIFKMYEDVLQNAGSQWVTISGTFSERFDLAVAHIDALRER